MRFRFELLRELRHQHGASIHTVSRLSGIPYVNISRWERGLRHPGAKNLAKMARRYNVKMEIFFAGMITPSG